MIKQLTIIGLGLIGGSIARAIKRTDFCEQIVGFDKQTEKTQKAQSLKIIDKSATTLAAAVKDADLIVLCVPINQFKNTLEQLKNDIKPTAVLTDVSSIKASIITTAAKVLGKKFPQFVPGHPIAGSEKSGLAAAKDNLFKNCTVILTPGEITNPAAIKTVKLFWKKMGAQSKILDSHLHDQLLGVTSHLPQLIAYLYMNDIQKNPHYPQILEYTGSGFKDFTRLAASNANLWKDIILANAETLLTEIQNFKIDLLALQTAIENSDEQLLLEIFTRAQQTREEFEKNYLPSKITD